MVTYCYIVSKSQSYPMNVCRVENGGSGTCNPVIQIKEEKDIGCSVAGGR